ncbi:MAG: hypothetical protein JW852_09150 [Spirochaetales bacterium]|nr:hypothetical protein [Spirochaetales bacterium]
MSDSQDQHTTYGGDIDPEIAELIGVDDESEEAAPGFGDLFGTAPESEETQKEAVDLGKKSFAQITETEEAPKAFFQDKDYYKSAMGGEGEVAKRFHATMTQFLNTQDPQERSLYRGKLISAYWNLVEQIAARAGSALPLQKRLMLRFGVVLPNIISAEQRQMLSKIILDNKTGEPVYYVDEWMNKIATGQINMSATDEVKVKKQSDDVQIVSKLEKAQGQRDVQQGLLSGKLADLESAEFKLKSTVDALLNRADNPAFPGLKYGYGEDQRSCLSEINNIVRTLSSLDREVGKLYQQLSNAAEAVEELKNKADEAGQSIAVVDDSGIRGEFNTVRQMAKMCVGRQGNHLPVLMKQYFRPNIRDIGTRENVIIEMAAIEAIDEEVFERTFKRQTNRIVPYVILVPCYGDTGVCWEPFERYNRATSRGRIAIPMFSKDLKTAVVAALGDLRWQVAKERAQHYWMEEGLTGNYYQWFEEKKMRGDVREAFIQDYILWITKESEGTQKLDRDVRAIFWRYVPFPQRIKDMLRNRGFLYAELYKRDKNREASDGY